MLKYLILLAFLFSCTKSVSDVEKIPSPTAPVVSNDIVNDQRYLNISNDSASVSLSFNFLDNINQEEIIRVYFTNKLNSLIELQTQGFEDLLNSTAYERFFVKKTTCIKSPQGRTILSKNTFCYYDIGTRVVRLDKDMPPLENYNETFSFQIIQNSNPEYGRILISSAMQFDYSQILSSNELIPSQDLVIFEKVQSFSIKRIYLINKSNFFRNFKSPQINLPSFISMENNNCVNDVTYKNYCFFDIKYFNDNLIHSGEITFASTDGINIPPVKVITNGINFSDNNIVFVENPVANGVYYKRIYLDANTNLDLSNISTLNVSKNTCEENSNFCYLDLSYQASDSSSFIESILINNNPVNFIIGANQCNANNSYLSGLDLNNVLSFSGTFPNCSIQLCNNLYEKSNDQLSCQPIKCDQFNSLGINGINPQFASNFSGNLVSNNCLIEDCVIGYSVSSDKKRCLAPNQPPFFSNTQLIEPVINKSFNFNLEPAQDILNDLDEDIPLTYEIFSLPAYGTLNCTLLNCNYVPQTNYLGSDSFQIRAFDGLTFSIPQTININVVSEPCDINNAQSYGVDLLNTISVKGSVPNCLVNICENLYEASLDETSCQPTKCNSSNSNGINGVISLNGNSFSGNLIDNNCSIESCSDSFVVSSDKKRCLAPNQPPSFNLTQQVDTYINHEINFTINPADDIFGDADEDISLTYQINDLTTKGTLTCSNLSCTYVPNLNEIGSDSFEVIAFDGIANSSPQIISIQIATEPCSLINAESYGLSLTNVLSVKGSAPNCKIDQCSNLYQKNIAETICSPIQCNISNSNGVNGVNSTHGEVFSGTLVDNNCLIEQCFDPYVLSSNRKKCLNPNEKPIFAITSYSFDYDGNPITIDSASDVLGDADEDIPLTYEVFDPPSNGFVTNCFNGNLSCTYTPYSSFTGIETFSVRAFDGIDYSDPINISIDVPTIPCTLANASNLDLTNILEVEGNLPNCQIKKCINNYITAPNDFECIEYIPYNKKIATGSTHSCGIINDNLYCWGDNSLGQIGQGSTLKLVNAILIDSEVKSVISRKNQTCYLKNNNSLYCSGENNYGQLLTGNNIILNNFQLVKSNIISYSLGDNHSCYVDELFDLYCIGLNNSGQLGDSSIINKSIPVKIFSKVKNVECRNNSCCLKNYKNNLYCWGQNNYNIIAIGDILSPILFSQNIISYSIGLGSYCYIDQNNLLFCAGANQQGQLGVSNPSILNNFQQIATNANLVKNGDQFSCYIDNNFFIKCSGTNFYGQLANSTSSNSYSFGFTIPTKETLDLDLAINHGCLLTPLNEIYCWGRNNFNQVCPLGNSTIRTMCRAL